MPEHSVLLVTADDAVIGAALEAFGAAADYRLMTCRTEKEADARLSAACLHLLIVDLAAIGDPRDSVLSRARALVPPSGRILLAPPDRTDDADQLALQAGAFLAVTKPVSAVQMRLLASRALEMAELARRHRALSRELRMSLDDAVFAPDEPMAVQGGASQFERMVYVSPVMAALAQEARRAAPTDLPVLIQGESGTGKELLARAIHYNSARLNHPLLVQDCGALSDEALHSELFGHVRGALAGAVSDRLGLLRAADGGTVLLDGISDMPPRGQASLLRFLQDREIKPLGSDRAQQADVRLVAASDRSLAAMVEAGEFRRDLYHRLKGFDLRVPPLRDRREDIPALVQFFVERYGGVVGRRVVGITKDALARMQAYGWPGNVRELESEIRRMVAVADQGGYLSAVHLSPTFEHVQPIAASPELTGADGQTLKEAVERLERELVLGALRRHNWNQSRAAEQLGLSRVGLANKVRRFGLHANLRR